MYRRMPIFTSTVSSPLLLCLSIEARSSNGLNLHIGQGISGPLAVRPGEKWASLLHYLRLLPKFSYERLHFAPRGQA